MNISYKLGGCFIWFKERVKIMVIKFLIFLHVSFFLLKPVMANDLCRISYADPNYTVEDITELIKAYEEQMAYVRETFFPEREGLFFLYCNEKNETPLFLAVQEPNASAEFIRLLIISQPDALYVTNTSGITPLEIIRENPELHEALFERELELLPLSSFSISGPSSDRYPEITVSGLEYRQIAEFFRNSNCTSWVGGKMVADRNQSSIQVSMPQLPGVPGPYDYYVQISDMLGNSSVCSPYKLTYELLER